MLSIKNNYKVPNKSGRYTMCCVPLFMLFACGFFLFIMLLYNITSSGVLAGEGQSRMVIRGSENDDS